MRRKDQSVTAALAPARGCELIIEYPFRTKSAKRQQRIVYVRRGVPAVTSAEIEIMFEHLEATLRTGDSSAQNDNR